MFVANGALAYLILRGGSGRVEEFWWDLATIGGALRKLCKIC